MKRIVFVSKSRLAQNLLELITPTLPHRTLLTCFSSLTELSEAYFAKPVHLVLIDENALRDVSAARIPPCLSAPAVAPARRILLAGKNTGLDREVLTQAGFAHIYTKPFLAEELAGILQKESGGRT